MIFKQFRYEPLDDGQVLRVGEVRVQALFTPGHTPEHTSYVDRLHAELDAWHVVDARDRFEWKYGWVPGADLLPWTDAWEDAEAFQDPGKPVAVICGDEVRSSLVASILARLAHRPSLVMGGMVDWIDRAYPQEKGET